MKIAVARETVAGERRVALTPDQVSRLVKKGWEIHVEAGAGEASLLPDAAYEEAGAKVVGDRQSLWKEADLLVKVAVPTEEEVALLPEGSMVASLLNPLGQPEIIQKLADKKITALGMELIPRTSRAQSMDVLSSQAGVAGYKAVLLAAAALPKFFPMLTTAAGTIRPAKVFVIGAGVAGLQAIATARRLGAVVEAFDIRPAVKEEVQSLGAKFVEVQLEEETATAGGYAKEVSEDSKKKSQALISDHVATADVVITTAQVPGRRAPVLVTDDMIARMQTGSVLIDLAGEQGGNCEGCEAGREVQVHGATIIAPINLPSTVPVHASQMFAKNMATLLQLLIPEDAINLDFADDILDSVCVTHQGEIRNQRVKDALQQMAVTA
ncbi:MULTISPECIES: Re/Si-specific NAD(P)(+) transhydrogenase subunit alpha [Cyanophyceae]|jgi:NAD(P) transhydrogenase subunit alpha|uniref:Re/Si-specific NAD(P)(+) transhydrogenase subunit alpha n=1 Tax=Cyanophyceae TaxID=3028117 RepID=UPI00016DC53C|nr:MULTISPECIES: Re/Si-specific NAD(P)(+) transhydrogenase subunit alpha [Cyanophyceae]ACA98989.1 nicotinamide nucleotide transhydrogenase, chain alpha, part 1 [Picosynechococcus sp. PCC 7002]SMH35995.1 NAD(P) transhydrogenase subunit alpha [Picosynechococcus sp. OG1]SMQ77650.1 NAD(P) transhydrogenase subunit alpha [Synechococcus sp. 7002]